MPKIQEFNIDSFSNQEIISLMKVEISKEIEKINMFNANIRIRPDNIGLTVPEISIDIFKESELGKQLIFKKYEEKKKQLISDYNELKSKLDYCLHDLKQYNQLCKNIDDLTYCSALDEMRELQSRYLYGRAISKAIYRNRSREYSNIQCN